MEKKKLVKVFQIFLLLHVVTFLICLAFCSKEQWDKVFKILNIILWGGTYSFIIVFALFKKKAIED